MVIVLRGFPHTNDKNNRLIEWKTYVTELLSKYPVAFNAELAQALETSEDFYCGASHQTKLSSWYRDRVALVGDAAYSTLSISGQGTSLALIRGYTLAYNLAKSGNDIEAAYRAYENSLKPIIEQIQDLALKLVDNS